MTEHDGGSPAPDLPPEPPTPGAAPEPEPGSRPDDADSAPGEGAEGPGARASEDDDDAPVPSAAELGAGASARRRLRQAGRESLGGVWFEAAARFAGPASLGGGTAVGGNLSSAGRDINFVFGDFTGRQPGPAGTDAGPVAAHVLARIRRIHVGGGSYAAAEQALRDARVVILRGPDGSGKRTSALRLLAELAGDDVHEVDAGAVLGPPDDAELSKQAGYLAEGGPGTVFAYHRMTAWAAKLGKLGGYLIVTVPAGTVIRADVAEHFLVDHQPPDGAAIVRSHLRADGKHAAAAERLLDRSGTIACATSPAAAAALASGFLALARGALPAAGQAPFVRALHGGEVRRMLGGQRPATQRDRVGLLCRRAAMISTAVFAELPYADAMAAADVLAAAFIAIEFPHPAASGRELFIRWPDLLDSEPGVSLEESELPGRWGRAAARHIRFSDPHLHGALLEEVWERYDTVRSPLLAWLADLALRAPDEAVRVRAAQVIGQFAIRDFGHVCHRLIAGWGNSVSERYREAAATALEAAAEGMPAHVWELVKEWCDSGSQHRQRTAILALGTAIGEQEPDGTLRQLGRLASRGGAGRGAAVAEAVRHSLIDLMSGPRQETVIHALSQWAEGKDARLAFLARRCVPPLAHLTDDSGRPSFLAVLTAAPALRADAVSLFGAALADPRTGQETWLALERLAVAAAPEARYIDALGELLHDLCLRPGAASRQVSFYLRLWARRNDKLREVIRDARASTTA